MTKALILANEKKHTELLIKKLNEYFPEIQVSNGCDCVEEAYRLIKNYKPQLVFVDLEVFQLDGLKFASNSFCEEFELIFISHIPDYAIKVINYHSSGYLLKPIKDEELILVVEKAKKKSIEKGRLILNEKLVLNYFQQIPPHNLIGIPTIEGLQFILANNIIRCEGLQKCTRVFITDKPNMISSYNIGEFRKILSSFSFFLTHKSHLVNLRHIKAYYKEGYLIMKDSSKVPVSTRRKKEFLQAVPHL